MRARNIKPGFFKNEELAECQPLARILFAGLWGLADRNGYLEDRPKRIKTDVLPYDVCDIDELLHELEAHGFIKRVVVNDTKVIGIPTFKCHQRPHPKEPEIFPALPGKKPARPRKKPAQPEKGTNEPEINRVEPDLGANEPCTFALNASNLNASNLNASNLNTESLNAEAAAQHACAAPTIDQLIEQWNAIPGVISCKVASEKRKGIFRVRIKNPTWVSNLSEALQKISQSKFCQGSGKQGWIADFDWFLQPDTVTKLIEGKYDDQKGNSNGHTKSKQPLRGLYTPPKNETRNVTQGVQPGGSGEIDAENEDLDF